MVFLGKVFGVNLKKRLMILTCFFPPDGGAGVQRSLKFTKYLPEYDWDVTVVTREVETDRDRDEFEPEDSSLLQELTSKLNCSLERVSANPLEKKTNSIDKFEPWAYAAGKRAVELLDETNFDAILITMSPFSLVRSAEYIRGFHKVPIILDFRDPWMLDGWQPYETYFHWLKYFRIMKKAVAEADGVIANTVESGKIFAKTFPEYNTIKHTVIENGYDAEDFEGFSELDNKNTISKNKNVGNDATLTLVFTGSLPNQTKVSLFNFREIVKRILRYSPEKIGETGRSLIHLIAAIKLLRKENHPLGFRIRIECYGVISAADKDFINESGLKDIVTFHGYILHDESIKYIKNADALFLPLHGLEKGKRSRIVPGKTYEYLATGRPILGCLPLGDARDFVEKSGVGVIADPTSSHSIAKALKKIADITNKEINGSYPLHWVKDFERKALTKRLSVFLNDICEKPQTLFDVEE